MQSREKWEREAGQRYSEMHESASHILETCKHIRATYAGIERSLAGIQEALRQDPKQGQQVVKIKRNLWRRADADTFSGHMDKMGGRLESKFVHETADLCQRALTSILELDLRLLGEFLKLHGVRAQKLDHEARAARYEEIIAKDPGSRPRFYNLRRNLLAIVEELVKAK